MRLTPPNRAFALGPILALLLLTAPSLAGSAHAAAPNPDWPCFSPLQPDINPALMWFGSQPPKGADWRKDAAISQLVAAIVPREVDLGQAEGKLKAFIAQLPTAGRKERLTLLFAGLLSASNDERHTVIQRIEDMTVRQRSLSLRIARISAKLGPTPPTQAQSDVISTSGSTLEFQRELLIRVFKSMQQTMRYACNVPPAIVARLARFAQIIQAH